MTHGLRQQQSARAASVQAGIGIPAGHGHAAGVAPTNQQQPSALCTAGLPPRAPQAVSVDAPTSRSRRRLTRGLAGELHHRPRAEQLFASPLWHFANSFGEPCIPRPANDHLAAPKARTPPPPHSCRSRASGSVGPAGLEQRDRYLDAPGSCSAPQARLHRVVVASQLPSRPKAPTSTILGLECDV